ncbi:MAG: serine hydrolase [Chloroflexi bacterium]|nr:serine hydrolase [Chloroflexota bacterium]
MSTYLKTNLRHRLLIVIGLILLAACAPVQAEPPLPPTSTPSAEPTEEPTLAPTATVAESAQSEATPTDWWQIEATATPSPTPPPAEVDYSAMIAEMDEFLTFSSRAQGYQLGVGFVDVQTGQVVHFDGMQRYHSMSTFKAPLVVHFLWLEERGELERTDRDVEHIINTLEFSANPSTTCLFERVGGVEAFNDWLAEQGMSREYNFVFKWIDWECNDQGQFYLPEIDYRYSQGDEELGIPGNLELLGCPHSFLPCDKSFAPAELAIFYERLYNGEIISQENVDQLMLWMEEDITESVFIRYLPDGAIARPYVKNGYRQADEIYRVNFYSEAGIVETPYGAFALTVFMQQNPDWPGSWPIGQIARIAYEHFVAAYEPDEGAP